MLKNAKLFFNEIIMEFNVKEIVGVKVEAIEMPLGDFYQKAIIQTLENDGIVHEYSYSIINNPKNGRDDALVYAKRILRNLEKTYNPTRSIGWEILDINNMFNPYHKSGVVR